MMSLGCATVPMAGALLLMISGFRGRVATSLMVLTSLIETGMAIVVATSRQPESSVMMFGRYFVLDAMSTLFLLLISIVFLGITVYVWRVTSIQVSTSIEKFVVQSLAFFSLSVLAVLSNHLLAMWVFLELGTLAIAPLIYFGRGENALRASWKYLLFSVVGLGFNFLGLLCLAQALSAHHDHSGLSFFLDDMKRVSTLGNPVWWELGLGLMVFGLGTKLGLAPMYSWLPDAYDEARPAVTTMLSAVQFNCVILALFRQVGLLRSFDPTLISTELIVMGSLSITVAALHIIRTDNYKRLIAYASINHAGTIALGLGVGKQAGYGVVLYVVSNALVKSVLFLTCGNIKTHFQTKKISSLSGLIHVMPFSGWIFMLGVFALLGFAPFGSFLGEVLIMSNMIGDGYLPVFFYVCIILTVILLATGRSLFPMIWGEAKEGVQTAQDPFWSNASSIFYIAILVSLGIYTPAPLTALLQEVATILGGR